MKKSALMGLAFLCASTAFADLSLEGHYQGRNIYVQSPESEDGFGYCINRVTVNGQPVSSDIQTSAFQIDLTEFDISIGDPVLILFEHEDGCRPKIINPEVILPKSTFVLEEISCTPDGVLSFSTTGESGKLPFVIEQYKWNKWVAVGEIDGIGKDELNSYKFHLLAHSGENKVRISQTDNTGKKRVAGEVVFTSTSVVEPELNTITNQRIIEFVAEGKRVKTKYEVFDAYGNIVKKGYNSIIDYSNLKKGVYHVNYDNKYDKVIVKG
ncbi:MAG: hypothetical protein MI810_13040 [Flavobacteriales bacterium]|jgi:hypothetical protein|nr:hypothetical protein [Flavobacteriales bacterium]